MFTLICVHFIPIIVVGQGASKSLLSRKDSALSPEASITSCAQPFSTLSTSAPSSNPNLPKHSPYRTCPSLSPKQKALGGELGPHIQQQRRVTMSNSASFWAANSNGVKSPNTLAPVDMISKTPQKTTKKTAAVILKGDLHFTHRSDWLTPPQLMSMVSRGLIGQIAMMKRISSHR